MKKYTFYLTMLFVCNFLRADAQAPNWLWENHGKSDGHEFATGVSTDNNGNCYMTGYYQAGVVDFGGTVLSNQDPENFFIVKYNNNGNMTWAKKATSSSGLYTYADCINTSSAGNCYVTGLITGAGNISFDTVNLLINQNADNAFIVKYDLNGNASWARELGQINQVISPSCNGNIDHVSNGIDKEGNVYVIFKNDTTNTPNTILLEI